jgi:2-phosphoglycerate kinase
VGHSDGAEDRLWDVLLIGGASGTGKTTVASRLAHHFEIGIGVVDDFQIILERMTTPEQQPVLHFWRTHSDPDLVSAEEIMRQGLEVARVMSSGLEAVIADHLNTRAPIALEGDFIEPALAAQTSFLDEPNHGRVRAVFLYEPDEMQILRNFSQREPGAGAQTKRARVSWLQGQWLESECGQRGIPILAARPGETLFDRILKALT